MRKLIKIILLLESLVLADIGFSENGLRFAGPEAGNDARSAGRAASSDHGQKWMRPRLGLFYGFNSARFIQSESGTKNRSGYSAGLFVCYYINRNTAFRPGIQYSRKGSGFSHFPTYYRLEYLEIPLLAAFYPIRHVQVHLGPSVAFFKKGRTESSGSTESSILRKQVLGFVIGMAMEYKVIFLGWGYSADLQPVFEAGGSAKNQVLQLNMGIIL